MSAGVRKALALSGLLAYPSASNPDTDIPGPRHARAAQRPAEPAHARAGSGCRARDRPAHRRGRAPSRSPCSAASAPPASSSSAANASRSAASTPAARHRPRRRAHARRRARRRRNAHDPPHDQPPCRRRQRQPAAPAASGTRPQQNSPRTPTRDVSSPHQIKNEQPNSQPSTKPRPSVKHQPRQNRQASAGTDRGLGRRTRHPWLVDCQRLTSAGGGVRCRPPRRRPMIPRISDRLAGGVQHASRASPTGTRGSAADRAPVDDRHREPSTRWS